MRHGDREQRDGLLIRVFRENRAHEIPGNLGEDRGCGNGRVKRYRPGNRIHIGEANAGRHGSAGPGFGAEPGADSVGEVKQGRPKHLLYRRLFAHGRLCACRSGPTVRLDFAGIAIPRQRGKFLSRCGTEQTLERPSRCVRQLPDGQHAYFFQPLLGGRPHAPHQLDGQAMQEIQLGAGIDHHQPVGFCDLRGNFRQMFCAGHAN